METVLGNIILNIIAKRPGIIMLISVILLGGFLTINYISYLSAKSSLRDSIIYSSLPLTRDNIYSEIQKDLMRPIFVSSLMSNDTFLKDWVLNGEKETYKIRQYLKSLKEEYGFFIAFFVSDITKKYYYEDGLHKVLSRDNQHDQWYYDFIDMHVTSDLNIDTSEAKNNELTIFINYRVYDYMNKLIGVAGVGLSLDRMTNLLASYSIKYDRNIYLVGDDGMIKAHENADLIEEKSLAEIHGLSQHASDILMAGYNPQIFEFDRNGERILLTSRYIPELKWFLMVEHNQTSSIKGIKHNLMSTSILGLFITLIIITIVGTTIHNYNKRLELLAVTDELTGSFNRREFERVFQRASGWYERTGNPFSIILIDIDKFKFINDTYGHLSGDEVIKIVTKTAKTCIREKDLLARWGGDEFIILIYEEKSTAVDIAERISDKLKNSEEIKKIMDHQITLSVGITEFFEEDTEDSLIRRADKALYKAKENGRDRIEII